MSKQKINTKSLFTVPLVEIIAFILGFVFGSIWDMICSIIYKKMDHEEQNNVLLILVFIVQIYTIFFIINVLKLNVSNVDYAVSFRLGVFASQLFLLEYVVDRISLLFMKREDIKIEKRKVLLTARNMFLSNNDE